MKTELLEALVRQCVREVLDQVQEEANASKLKSSGIGKDDNKQPDKQKKTIPVQFKKGKGFKPNIKKLNEEEDPNAEKKPEDKPEDKPQEPSPEKGPEASAPAVDPSDPPAPATPAPPTTPGDQAAPPTEPAPAEKPMRIPKGASFINPKDKSQLDPIRWMGRDEGSIERTLHQWAVKHGGPRTKVSLGAKRLGRESAANPTLPIHFYLGKMDPESDEVFLMADKNLQIAKDDSIQPGDLTGTPVIGPTHNYPVYGQEDDLGRDTSPDSKYSDWMTRGKITPTATPRYGIDEPELNESAAKLIKKVVNKILDV